MGRPWLDAQGSKPLLSAPVLSCLLVGAIQLFLDSAAGCGVSRVITRARRAWAIQKFMRTGIQPSVQAIRSSVASLPSPSTTGHPNAAGAPCSKQHQTKLIRPWTDRSLICSPVSLYQIENL